MNDTLFYWLVEGLGKGAVWLGICLMLSPWAGRRGWRVWRMGWLVLGAMTLLSLAPTVWHWTWAESTRRVLASVEAGWEPVVGVEAEPMPPGAGVVVATTESGPPGPTARPWLTIWTGRQWVVAVWAAGVVFSGAWLAWGFWVAERWRREAVAVDDPAWRRILRDEAADMAVTRLPVLAVHTRVPGPCLVGIGRRVTLLLPTDYGDWDFESRRAVVRHELAHLIGRDGLFAVFRSIVLALHWPNPLAWVAAVKDRREQEMAADRLVLASGLDRGNYASLLLRLARDGAAGRVPAACHSMAGLTHLEGRFRAILGASPAPAATRRWSRGISALAALGVAVGAGCSSYRSPGSDPTALTGPRTPRVPVMDADLRGHLGTDSNPPNGVAEFRFQVVDKEGVKRPPQEHMGLAEIFFSVWGSVAVELVDGRSTKPARSSVLREIVYPTAFDLPEFAAATVGDRPKGGTPPMTDPNATNSAGASTSIFPVTPTTPTAFSKKHVGTVVELTTIRQQGDFFVIQGLFIETVTDGFVEGAGEAFSPIMTPATTALGRPTTVMLTENQVKQPTFTTRESPFVVSALPGKTYRVRVNTLKPGYFLELKLVAIHKT